MIHAHRHMVLTHRKLRTPGLDGWHRHDGHDFPSRESLLFPKSLRSLLTGFLYYLCAITLTIRLDVGSILCKSNVLSSSLLHYLLTAGLCLLLHVRGLSALRIITFLRLLVRTLTRTVLIALRIRALLSSLHTTAVHACIFIVNDLTITIE